MPEQINQPVASSDEDTLVLRIPAQRNGRGYAGARSYSASSIATNSVPARRIPARSLREALGL
ncbi:hypothetical protein AB0B94_30365 [Micromonospora sp. NPDC048986]|uniref:hypothetical protein n=1 Tax=Micromonospora sp. NPDC048986 TaxID=3155644 RepID=UPI0033EC3741